MVDLIDRLSLVYGSDMSCRNLSFLAGLALLAGLLASCHQGPPELMPRQELFHLQLGTLEDQMDLMLRNGLPSPEKNRFFYYHGLFLVANGNARKVMEFTSYGGLITLFYNPADNPVPVQMGKGGVDQVQNRRAFPYPFRHVGEIAADSQDHLYVEDGVPDERVTFDSALKTRLTSIVLRFNKDGKLQDFLGQEGVGGTPFPPIDKLSVSTSDVLTVLCRTGAGWAAWWFRPDGTLEAKALIPWEGLPRLAGEPPGSFADAEIVRPDPTQARLWLQVDYFRRNQDPTTKTESGISLIQSRILSFDPQRSAFLDGFALPIIAREPSRPGKEVLMGDRPLQFLGLSRAGLLFFLSSPENGGERFLVLDQQGRLILERTIAYSARENSWISDYQITPSGVLVAMTCDGSQVDFSWWRSDKLLNSYAPLAF